MKKIILLLFTACISLFLLDALFAQSKLEIPVVKNNEVVVKRFAYTFSYNEDAEQSAWVAYYLTPSRVNGAYERTNKFTADPLVKTSTANNADYRKSGYDKGHLAPAADMSWSSKAMEESFYFGNISPQLPGFNRGVWKKLEEAVRDWALQFDTVFIVTGPILKKGLPEIGANGVDIPEAFYKTLLFKNNNKFSGTAYLIPNQSGLGDYSNYKTTIDQVEKITGIDFYYMLEDGVEREIESNIQILQNNY